VRRPAAWHSNFTAALTHRPCHAANNPALKVTQHGREPLGAGLRLSVIFRCEYFSAGTAKFLFALRQACLAALADKPRLTVSSATFAMPVRMKRPIALVTSGMSQHETSAHCA
jgi:hypothetical protein